MARRSGSANLPLHGGRVPAWLSTRMAELGTVITEAIVQHYGRDEFLRRLAHPFWFQSFGAVMGMDWHSSGITTSVMGALKRGLTPRAAELGLYVCGGRGRHSRKTPEELRAVGDSTGLDGDQLARTSKLVAKVDSAAVQDGYELYLHSFVVASNGKWTVAQQGMSPVTNEARRYHWLSETVVDFVDSPHEGVSGANHGVIVNLADRRADDSRTAQLQLLRTGPSQVVELFQRAGRFAAEGAQAQPEHTLVEPTQRMLPHLAMPAHHDVRPKDVVLRRLHGALAAAEAQGPKDFSELLLTQGVGARTIKALALVAEVVHGAPCRFSDPARFSIAHGGKDGHPFPVPLLVYDETIGVLKRAVSAARLGNDAKLAAIQRLDQQARLLEQTAEGPELDGLIAEERELAPHVGGRTVLDDLRNSSGPVLPKAASRPRSSKRERREHHPAQLALFPSG